MALGIHRGRGDCATRRGTIPREITRRTGGGSPLEQDAPIRALVLLSVGLALAFAGGNSSAVFIVASSVDRGLAPSDAGLVLASGSLVGVVVRVLAGWLGDLLGRGSLLLVAILAALGAVGYIGLAFGSTPELIAPSATLAFGGGWGGGGLILLATSRANPIAPGTAMGIVMIGPLAGAVVGPLAFGALAEHVAYSAAWLLMAAMAIVGSGIVLLSRQLIVRGRPRLASVQDR